MVPFTEYAYPVKTKIIKNFFIFNLLHYFVFTVGPQGLEPRTNGL